jgi:hypothetical protein
MSRKHNGILTQNLNILDYDMRRRCDFHVLICNTSLFKNNLINMGIKLYNKLSNRIKRVETLKC